MHRIGQKSAVKIYRLLTRKSYEQVLFARASLKLGLDKAVIQQMRGGGGGASAAKAVGGAGSLGSAIFGGKMDPQDDGGATGGSSLSAREVEHLLKRGAYEVFKEGAEEAEAAQQSFTTEDIDSILQRSTTLLRYDDGRTTAAGADAAAADAPDSTLGGAVTSAVLQPGAFSKASFVTADGAELDIDDVDFWEKAVGLKAPPPPDPAAEALAPRRSAAATDEIRAALGLGYDAGQAGGDGEDEALGQVDGDDGGEFEDGGTGDYVPGGKPRRRGTGAGTSGGVASSASAAGTAPSAFLTREEKEDIRRSAIIRNALDHSALGVRSMSEWGLS